MYRDRINLTSRDIYENGYYIHVCPRTIPSDKDRILFDIDIFALPFEDAICELRYEFTSDFIPLWNSSKATRAVYVYNDDTLIAEAYYYVRENKLMHTDEEYDEFVVDFFDKFFIIVSRWGGKTMKKSRVLFYF